MGRLKPFKNTRGQWMSRKKKRRARFFQSREVRLDRNGRARCRARLSAAFDRRKYRANRGRRKHGR